MIFHTVSVKPLENYRLHLAFNNGVSGEVDLSSELWGEIFELAERYRALPNRTSG